MQVKHSMTKFAWEVGNNEGCRSLEYFAGFLSKGFIIHSNVLFCVQVLIDKQILVSHTNALIAKV